MKIKTTQRLVVEDFPEQKSWIAKMFAVINGFFSDVIGILNGGLTFADNCAGVDKVFDFVYVSAASLPVSFNWPLVTRPAELRVISAFEAPAGSLRTGNNPIIVSVAWEYGASNSVNLTDVVVLSSSGGASAPTAGSRYIIRVRVTP